MGPNTARFKSSLSLNKNLRSWLKRKELKRKMSPKNSGILPTPGLEPGPYKDVVLSHACLPIPSRGQSNLVSIPQ